MKLSERVYILVSGLMFAALLLAHVYEIYLEGAQVLGRPVWLGITAMALVMTLWAFNMVRGKRHH